MSDAARQNLKVSREGIVLIKSFEGFRPRAIQRAEGGWIIGYGHTLSAREGATVSEADAELLLRYDLLPVEASVNGTVPTDLNQHQFDALVSFAFSVGVDRFASSDVRQRLAAGSPAEAADAIMGWPEPTLPETALRRRAAERALFVANPGAPVALSDLLSAPLPPPPVPAPIESPVVEPVAEAEPEPVASEEPASPAEAEPEVDPVAPVDPRGAAVAALLGEPQPRLVQDETPTDTIIPTFGAPAVVVAADAALEPSNDNPFVDEAADAEVPETDVIAKAPEAEDEAETQPPVADATQPSDPVAEAAPAFTATIDEPSVEEKSGEPVPAEAQPIVVNPAVWSVARYAPYSLSMVGPLPYLQPAAARLPESPAIAPTASEAAVEESDDTWTDPVQDAVEIEPVETAMIEPTAEVEAIEVDNAAIEETSTGPESDLLVEAVEAEVAAAAEETPVAVDQTPVVETASVFEPEPVSIAALEPIEADAPVEPMTYVPPLVIAPVAELVLTPLDDSPEPAFARPLWTTEERDAPDGSETNLFGEDLSLTLGGSVMRHEMEFEAPAKFDWKETAPFIFMGGVGLVSFGASMAAFRRAAEQSGGSELTIIGWVLALIGLGCVGVSSVNLYRKFGLPGGD